MLEQQDLTNLESMMKRIVNDSVTQSEERMKVHVTDSIHASEERMKVHVADSIHASEERMKIHVADSIHASEERMKIHVADSICASEERMKAHVEKSIHDSETLMLDEMERYSNANLKRIEKLERKMDTVYPFYQIKQTDSEHMNNLFGLYYKLQEKLAAHDIILSDHRTQLNTHSGQIEHLMASCA